MAARKERSRPMLATLKTKSLLVSVVSQGAVPSAFIDLAVAASSSDRTKPNK